MIFVTVGTHYQGFERLVRKMDGIISEINENCIMQIGNTVYKPVNAEYFDYVDDYKMISLMREARIIVSHAGVGSILTAFEQKIPLVIVPRLKKFNEHLNDHQLEISEALKNNPNVKVIYDLDNLKQILSSNMKFQHIETNNSLVHSLKMYIDKLHSP